MRDEEKFAIIARNLIEKALYDELVRFNESMMHYVTESNREILKAIEDLDRKLALLGILPLGAVEGEPEPPAGLREGSPDAVRAGMQLRSRANGGSGRYGRSGAPGGVLEGTPDRSAGRARAPVDELEEEDGTAPGDREVADLVDDQECRVGQGLEALIEASRDRTPRSAVVPGRGGHR